MVPSRPSFWGSARSRWRRSTVGACVQGGRAKLPGPREGPREQLVRRRAEQRVRRRAERLVRRIPFTRLNTLQRLRMRTSSRIRRSRMRSRVSLYVLVRVKGYLKYNTCATLRFALRLFCSGVRFGGPRLTFRMSFRRGRQEHTAARRDAARRGATAPRIGHCHP